MHRTLMFVAGLLLVNVWGCEKPGPTGKQEDPEVAESRAEPAPYIPASAEVSGHQDSLDSAVSADELSLLSSPVIPIQGDSSAVPLERGDQQPKDPLHRARGHMQKGEHKEAVSAYREFLRQKPEDAVAHFELAMALNAIGEPARATPTLDAAIRLSPEYLEAYLERGNTFIRRGLIRQALADYEAAHRLAPGRADIICAMANATLGLRKFADAEALADQAIELDPGFGIGYVIRGLSRAVQNKLEQAEGDLELAMRNHASPGDLETLSQQISLLKKRTR